MPKDLTDAKLENNQSHLSGSTSNQGLTQDVPAGPGPVTLIGDTLDRDIDVQNLGNSCSEQFNRDNDSFFISNPIDRQACETSFEIDGNSCLAKNMHETQKRVQKDPPSDSDVSVIKKLREDVSDSGESHPSNISVSTALHKDYGTSSDTLSPLSPMEEEYGTSGGVKRLTDSGYNTTGVYLSEENLSLRSRGHTLKDTETFSEDSP